MDPIKVYAEWNIDDTQWVVTSSDIAGLVIAANSIADLQEKLKLMVPELMLRNKQNVAGKELSFMLVKSWPVIQYFSNQY